jgi:hypothetical protein
MSSCWTAWLHEWRRAEQDESQPSVLEGLGAEDGGPVAFPYPPSFISSFVFRPPSFIERDRRGSEAFLPAHALYLLSFPTPSLVAPDGAPTSLAIRPYVAFGSTTGIRSKRTHPFNPHLEERP